MQAERRAFYEPDEILQAVKDKLEKAISSYQVNDEVTLHAFRRDELSTFTLVLTEAPLDTCYLEINDSVDTQVNAARQKWLHHQ
jgi:predicted metalloprotease with PDZ domain